MEGVSQRGSQKGGLASGKGGDHLLDLDSH